MSSRQERRLLGEKRLCNILQRQIAANARTLEQKISDAGPTNQRIDPHILTESRSSLQRRNTILALQKGGIPWYHLATTDPLTVNERVSELVSLHSQTQQRQFVTLLGQTLEIAVFRALLAQSILDHFGHFSDLDTHDDSTLYKKEEPPTSISGRQIASGKKLDFLIHYGEAGYAGLEIKNTREWLYPDRTEIRELLAKCCSLNVVPVLIARRIHFSTFSILNRCGVIIHQTFNQLYPNSARDLAERVRDKKLLGYHDVRVGNLPDARLTKFIEVNLPTVLPVARHNFESFKDLLSAYGHGEMPYRYFAALVKRRARGESEGPAEDLLDDYEPFDFYE